MDIKLGDLHNEKVISLLYEHHKDMLSHSPVESVHALDLKALEQSDITFWSLWNNQDLAGVGALKELDNEHGEIKSMRTSSKYIRKGVAQKLLSHIIEEAKVRSYQKLSLETGTMEVFLPAQQLYQKFGFKICNPFGEYQEDPYSMYMTKEIMISN
jgi:putative acetyltransferase